MRTTLRSIILLLCLAGCGSSSNGHSTSSSITDSMMLQKATYSATLGGGASQQITNLTITPTGGTSFSLNYSVSYPTDIYGYNAVLLAGSTQNSGSFFITSPTAGPICYVYKYDVGTATLYLKDSTTSPSPQTSCNAVIDSNAMAYVAQTMG